MIILYTCVICWLFNKSHNSFDVFFVNILSFFSFGELSNPYIYFPRFWIEAWGYQLAVVIGTFPPSSKKKNIFRIFIEQREFSSSSMNKFSFALWRFSRIELIFMMLMLYLHLELMKFNILCTLRSLLNIYSRKYVNIFWHCFIRFNYNVWLSPYD